MRRKYEADELRAMFGFCGEDFERFLDLLAWMDTLSDREAGEQLSAAKSIREARQNS